MTGWPILAALIALICYELPGRVVLLGLNVLVALVFVAMFVQQRR